MRLIHDGHGAVMQFDDAPHVDLTEAKPRREQRMRVHLKSAVRHMPVIKSHTNYKSGFIYEMGDDQCRFPISVENHLMCGAVIQNGRTVMHGKPYCDAHCKIV